MSKLKFNSKLFNELSKNVNKQSKDIAKQAILDASVEVAKIMRECIQKYYYDAYDPDVYTRTFTLLNSVTRKNLVATANGYRIEIVLDDSAKPYTHEFYIDGYGRFRRPKTYGQTTPTIDVFDLASQGIHGLPERGKSGWNNYNYISTPYNFVDKINEELDRNNGEILRQFSDALVSHGFQVRHKQ